MTFIIQSCLKVQRFKTSGGTSEDSNQDRYDSRLHEDHMSDKPRRDMTWRQKSVWRQKDYFQCDSCHPFPHPSSNPEHS